MKIFIAVLLLCSSTLQAQEKSKDENKWKIDKNKLLTGGLIFLSGSAKGFNETLQFNYPIFEKTFPGVNDQWFNPKISWRNKYKDANPDNGPKFFLSTSAFVMFTDQYHLNNFIHKAALTSAIVIRISDGKKPFKHYLFDLLYYSACYQAGFSALYYPFTSRDYK